VRFRDLLLQLLFYCVILIIARVFNEVKEQI
jgi:hypothetical protein